jgi:hypothetical protein
VKTDVVQAATTEHRDLMVGLIIAFDLEHVELGSEPQVENDHPRSARELRTIPFNRGLEHVDVELRESITGTRDRGDVIDALN